MSTDPPTWLTPAQARAWLAWIRLQLRLTYEINRQLQETQDMSLSDWDVLTALSSAPGPVPLSGLAAQIGWERSRLSHHLRRMEDRGLVRRSASETDRRVTVVSRTPAGRAATERAAPGHVALVRQLFFDGLPEEQIDQLTSTLERINAHVRKNGTLPRRPE